MTRVRASPFERFGGFAFAFLLGKLLELVGYGGAGTVNTILSPRKAAAAAARAAAEADGQAAGAAAGWDAIAARKKEPPSTWTDARVALGLSVRQAVWSCGGKMLLWHWTQPLSYFAVLGVYYCSLGDDQHRFIGMVVAVREALYLVSTLLALWLNPAYLLMELGSVWKDELEGPVSTNYCSRSVDLKILKRWTLYLLAPHQYVARCLGRGIRSTRARGCVNILLLFTTLALILADLVSALALRALLQQVEPPTALAIGWPKRAAAVAPAPPPPIEFRGELLVEPGSSPERLTSES